MYGVVIWSDENDRKAVIWCEDHGDLAFCSDTMDAAGCILDTGDLIQFDVSVDRHMRLAVNPRRVRERAYEGLAESLRCAPLSDAPVAVPSDVCLPPDVCVSPKVGADVIPFDRAAHGYAPARQNGRDVAAR